MSYWQEAAAEHFPAQNIQSPAELYIAAGNLLAERILGVEVSLQAGTHSTEQIADLYSTQRVVMRAAKDSAQEILSLVGYRLGYKAMTTDAAANSSDALHSLLTDPRKGNEPNKFQSGWAALFNVPVSQKLVIHNA